jgi:hypothetical protein
MPNIPLKYLFVKFTDNIRSIRTYICISPINPTFIASTSNLKGGHLYCYCRSGSFNIANFIFFLKTWMVAEFL